jgi:hypothetical protein
MGIKTSRHLREVTVINDAEFMSAKRTVGQR